jgi:hypothetical protein
MARCDRYNIICNKACQWLATGQWFSPGTPVSSTNKTDSHDITELLLKVVLNTITLSQMLIFFHYDCKISLQSLLINTIMRNSVFFLLCFFSFVSKKEARHCYRGGGGHVFLVNYTLNLSYIFMQKNPIFLYNFCQKWLKTWYRISPLPPLRWYVLFTYKCILANTYSTFDSMSTWPQWIRYCVNTTKMYLLH